MQHLMKIVICTDFLHIVLLTLGGVVEAAYLYPTQGK